MSLADKTSVAIVLSAAPVASGDSRTWTGLDPIAGTLFARGFELLRECRSLDF